VGKTESGTFKAEWGAWLSLACYLAMAVLKCWTGWKSGSEAVLADGFNNVTDILLSAAILVGIQVAGLPADRNHPFGHRKAETVSTLIAATFMALVALEVWLHSLGSLFVSQPRGIGREALVLSIGSALLMFAVSVLNLRLSRKTGSQALLAAACDNRSDALVSLGAAVGILGAQAGLHWLDPLAALVVGGVIMKTAWEVGKPAADALMDGFEAEKLTAIEERVKTVYGIHQVKELRARKHGTVVFVELTVGVDPCLSVRESHALTERVEEKLIGYENIGRVHVHVEPVA
jgi:cation diffusion facilitator family transporter